MRSVPEYKTLLEEDFSWSEKAREKYSGIIQCGPGCGNCCKGLFYVSKLDILLIAQGFMSLSLPMQNESESRARVIKSRMRDQDTYCPFLSDRGTCIIYDSRPFICRLQGLPVHDGIKWSFESCCEHNDLLRERINREEDTGLFHFDFDQFTKDAKRLFSLYGLMDDYGKYYVIPDFIDLL